MARQKWLIMINGKQDLGAGRHHGLSEVEFHAMYWLDKEDAQKVADLLNETTISESKYTLEPWYPEEEL